MPVLLCIAVPQRALSWRNFMQCSATLCCAMPCATCSAMRCLENARPSVLTQAALRMQCDATAVPCTGLPYAVLLWAMLCCAMPCMPCYELSLYVLLQCAGPGWPGPYAMLCYGIECNAVQSRAMQGPSLPIHIMFSHFIIANAVTCPSMNTSTPRQQSQGRQFSGRWSQVFGQPEQPVTGPCLAEAASWPCCGHCLDAAAVSSVGLPQVAWD